MPPILFFSKLLSALYTLNKSGLITALPYFFHCPELFRVSLFRPYSPSLHTSSLPSIHLPLCLLEFLTAYLYPPYRRQPLNSQTTYTFFLPSSWFFSLYQVCQYENIIQRLLLNPAWLSEIISFVSISFSNLYLNLCIYFIRRAQ